MSYVGEKLGEVKVWQKWFQTQRSIYKINNNKKRMRNERTQVCNVSITKPEQSRKRQKVYLQKCFSHLSIWECVETGTTTTDFHIPKELTFLVLMDSTDTLHISKLFVEVKNNRKVQCI